MAVEDFETGLSESEQDVIRESVQRGIRDIEEGRFEDFDADGLRRLGAEVVAQSARKNQASG